MTAPPSFRLPTEPYPGLRPFLDHESSLLFGRARQVREVIEHLRETRFVAVIGGSGSGKSSLIHAGVVPELRSFGIPGAGDFWIPMVCTPGTNAGQALPGQPENTPITRLAWKFSRLLKSRGSDAADAQRVADIAALFRQDAGFARLVDTYAKELAVAPGPDPGDARLLFVIDQFEELFHPTNKEGDDARRMVERVIDHFFQPHERCFLVLTMRSEHLNDCASYLELPDAINKSSYLVRRLDEDELREAIKAPAQRFLRLLKRQKSVDPASLPAEVTFDDGVLNRLLADVKSLTHDPDHLPLLQHLLARVWEMACKREGVGAGGVPETIVPEDLSRAVLAADSVGAPIDDKLNVLRASLENWAEAIYARRAPAQQLRIQALLKRLAFKDPNTGMYTQQRVNVDDTRLFDDDPEPSNRAALWALIEDPDHGRNGQFGYIGSVDYLFWDDENPQSITLKVSHESFIRGWSRFRGLIDKEAERFEEFVSVLRRCAAWASATGESRQRLLEPADLLRLHDARLERVFEHADERAAWFRVLLLDRDGARLARYEPQVDEFLSQSRAKQLEAEQLQRDMEQRRRAADAGRKRMRNMLWVLAVVSIAPIMFMLFSTLVQEPARRTAELYFEARNLADQAPVADNYSAVESAAVTLKTLVQAAALIEKGHGGELTWSGVNSRWFLDQKWAPGVTTHEVFLSKASLVSEPGVNGQLRALLSRVPWASARRPDDVPASEAMAPNVAPVECTVARTGARLPGTLFLEAAGGDDPQLRGLFVPAVASTPGNDVALHPARLVAGMCSAGEAVWTVPRFLNPQILLDANVRYMAVAVDGRPGVGDPSVTIYQVIWGDGTDGSGFVAQMRSVSVLPGRQAVEQVRNEFAAKVKAGAVNSDAVAAGVKTWRELGGLAFSVAGKGWQLVSDAAQRLDAEVKATGWVEIKPAGEGSPCRRLGELLEQGAVRGSEQASFLTVMYEHAKLPSCFAITRGNPPSAVAAESAGLAAPRERVLVAVYPQPNDAELERHAPPPVIASLVQFGRFAPDHTHWFVGVQGPHEGWIALGRQVQGASPPYDGAPWSTGALKRLGDGILSHQAASAAPAASAGRATRP